MTTESRCVHEMLVFTKSEQTIETCSWCQGLDEEWLKGLEQIDNG